MNSLYPNHKFSTGGLVFHPIFKFCKITSLSYSKDEAIYTVLAYDNRVIKDVPEHSLRNLTFGEFLAYRGPDGIWKCGKNRLVSILFSVLFLLGVSIYSFINYEDSPFIWVGIGCLAIISLIFRGTWRNYEGFEM